MSMTTPLAQFRVGDRVALDDPQYPGAWMIQRLFPRTALLRQAHLTVTIDRAALLPIATPERPAPAAPARGKRARK